jgi:hypothetical protein
MKITQVTEVDITFDNGNRIYFDHDQDCCEHNYADFKQIDDLAWEWDFDENLKFESCPHSGFRFGNEGRMVFVPCYSSQNGYYSTWIDIYYAPCWCGVLLDGGHVLGFNAKMDEYE